MPAKVKVRRPHPLKREVKRAGITYGAVAQRAGVTWWMVYAVLTGRKVSAPVVAAVQALLKETAEAKPA